MRTRLRGVSQTAIWIAILASSQLLWSPFCAEAGTLDSASSSQTAKIPTLQELEHGIADRLKRVEEFKFIEQEAAKLGVRAWLFGGTAAGYAHYVKWDMQREKGDKRFQKDRFDYDYTNIYRSTQDLDIVIDGNPGQAQKLQSALQEKYPHLQGSKTAWEVRLLTQDMGDKQAILNNPDFMNQHTDSNSTGMVEITKPHTGESVVRDVRDWKSKETYFLKDIHEGALHYYFSPLHETTQFAREGRNPPIVSAIRYLTKAFQYELKIRPEDLERIKKVIHEFDPKRDTQNSYVANWIEKNGKKLFQNAVNIEYAWNTLEQLGLRSKLQEIKGDLHETESLAWWMNKEPLRTHPVGRGGGKTAKELGLDIVGHETNNFSAYESITRAHTGDPNVLISRNDIQGEAAIHGDGFYTAEGREGARGTGLTIRFHLDASAREGSDFIRVPEADFVIIKNKSAIKVIPESLNIDPVEYFRILAADKTGTNAGLGASDRGIFEKLKRRIGAKLQALNQNDQEKIVAILRQEIPKTKGGSVPPALEEWFSGPFSTQYPELVESLIKEGGADQWVVEHILSKPQWQNRPDLVEALLSKGTADRPITYSVLSKSYWQNHPQLVEALLKKGTADFAIPGQILSKPYWKNHPEWIDTLIDRGSADAPIAGSVLKEPHWRSHPKWAGWVDRLLAKKDSVVDYQILTMILDEPFSKEHPEWIEDLIKREKPPKTGGDPMTVYKLSLWNSAREKLHDVLEKPHWRSHPTLLRMADGNVPTVEALSRYFASGGASLRVPGGSCISHQLDRLLK
jgi:hypothetical protein